MSYSSKCIFVLDKSCTRALQEWYVTTKLGNKIIPLHEIMFCHGLLIVVTERRKLTSIVKIISNIQEHRQYLPKILTS